MLIYVDEIIQEIGAIQEYATIVRDKFDAGRPAAELLLDAKALHIRVENLAAMMPERAMAGEALRHSSWMVHWLTKNDVASCTDDVHGIVDRDLPQAIANIQEWANKLTYVDADLRQEIAPLIRTRQFDSAIRKAFVVLKTRLVEKFQLAERLDGVPLVNELLAGASFKSRAGWFASRRRYSAGDRESSGRFSCGV